MGPRRSGRWAEAERNDIRVLEAARVVFSNEGPEAPIAAVAREAGVGMGTLYRRYGSKDELLQRLWVLSMEHVREEIEAALTVHAEPFDVIARFVRRCVDQRVGALSSVTGMVTRTDEVERSLAALYESVDVLLERGRAAGQIRDDVTAVDVLGLLVLFANPSPYTDADRLLSFTLDGLRANT